MSRCGMSVVDQEMRARICGAPATTERTVYGVDFPACASCAAAFDAKEASGAPYVARTLERKRGGP